jgi:hypothetical protein
MEALFARRQSDLEGNVIHWIAEHGVRLPDATQQTIYDREGVFYEPKIVAFVD